MNDQPASEDYSEPACELGKICQRAPHVGDADRCETCGRIVSNAQRALLAHRPDPRRTQADLEFEGEMLERGVVLLNPVSQWRVITVEPET